MKAEQHRAMRHAFVARVEVVDLDSERQLIARTGNLSTFGCFIETGVSFRSRNTNTDENYSSRDHVRGAGAGGGYANDGDGSSVRVHGTGAPADSGELAGAAEKWHELSFKVVGTLATSPICPSICFRSSFGLPLIFL